MLRAIFTDAAGENAVLYTLGNTNNQIGVPQNLLRLNENIRYAVIEMGTNHHGEIAPLSQCSLPDGAIINTIAPCHLENLGDLEGVALEKSAVYSGMKPGSAIAVYPAECAGKSVIEQAAGPFKNVTFGNSDSAGVSAEYLEGTLLGSTVKLFFHATRESATFSWNLTGRHQAENAAAAAALAFSMHIPVEIIVRGLSNTTLPGKRMNSITLNGTTWINDAYNANPQSMKSSLASIAENSNKTAPLLLVLGDMLELGGDEISYHREVLEFVQKSFAAHNYKLYLLGKRFAGAAKMFDQMPGNMQCFEDLESLTTSIIQTRTPGMTIFLKSSNSIGLSKVEPC
ncbi:MAG: UDP-N-acetylmuramoyl-tripeptide--D-alanyl-D-alanine ligase, partial [Lentisphaeria bacterium]|nr:UDP-N-acetylmuramoyl-tripeptide--D-alanyl-D-alanine ligase [Lentisphaeria bacterium]